MTIGPYDQIAVHDLERIAKAELDAARKSLQDCREHENAYFEIYLTASIETTNAHERERNAFHSWLEASRNLANEQAP